MAVSLCRSFAAEKRRPYGARLPNDLAKSAHADAVDSTTDLTAFFHTPPVNCGEKHGHALDCGPAKPQSSCAARPVTARHAIGSWSGTDKAASLWREPRSATRPPPGGTVRAQRLPVRHRPPETLLER